MARAPLGMHKERREVLNTLNRIIAVLNVYAYFLDGSEFVLCLRFLLLMQTQHPTFAQPGRPAGTFSWYITTAYALLAYLQLDRPSSPPARRIILDYIGQDRAVSWLHLLCLDLLIWFLHLTLLGVTVENKRRLHEASTSSLHTPQEQNAQDAAPERPSGSTQETFQDSAQDTAEEPLLAHDQRPDADQRSDVDQRSDEQTTPSSSGPPEQSVLPTTTRPVAVVLWKALWAANSTPRDTT